MRHNNKFLMLWFLLFLIQRVYCQAPAMVWEEALGSIEQDQFSSVQPTQDNGSVFAGEVQYNTDRTSYKGGLFDAWLVKLDANGHIVWDKDFGGSKEDHANCVRQTNEGGFVFAGYTSSNDSDVSGNHGNFDAWVVKTDSSGNIEWQKCLGGSGSDQANCIQQTTDGGYIVACQANSNDGEVTGLHVSTVRYDYWIVKLDKAGNIEWQECLGGYEDDIPLSIQQTTEKGYIIAGSTASTDGDVTGNTTNDYTDWIVKLDSAGKLEWEKVVGVGQSDIAEQIKQTSDSGYIIAGSNHVDILGINDNCQIIKMDKNGNVLWQREYGGTGNDDAFDIEIVKNGYVVAGTSNSTDGQVTDNHGEFDFWVFKIDTIGNLVWQKSMGGSMYDMAYCITYKPNVGYFIGGATSSGDGQVTGYHGNGDAWVVKLADDAILPVTLLSFTAQKQNNTTLLQWQTANEINNSYFGVERSADGGLFTSIGEVSALKTSAVNNYAFTDNAPLQGNNYYRLKQVDKDGKFTYSKIATVDFSNAGRFAVYPNPASSSLNVTVPTSNSSSQLMLFDVNGKKVMNESVSSNIISKQINISKLPAGVYSVVLVHDGKQQTVKVVKK